MGKAVKTDTGLYAVEIDGQTYEFEKWGADKSTDVLFDLMSVVGKPLGMALAFASQKDSLAQEVTPDFADNIMEHLSNAVGEKKSLCKSLIKRFCSEDVLCDGVKINYNTHYADRLDHMFRVVAANVEVQYGNFFGGSLGSVAGALQPKARPMNMGNRDPKSSP